MSSVFAKKIRFYLEEKHVLVKLTLIIMKVWYSFQEAIGIHLEKFTSTAGFLFPLKGRLPAALEKKLTLT